MKLKIIEYFWSVGHRTRRKGTYKLPLIEGKTLKPHFANLRVDKVEEDKAIVSFNRDDGTLIKKFTVEKGKQNYYRPISMDGGYEYVLKFTRF